MCVLFSFLQWRSFFSLHFISFFSWSHFSILVELSTVSNFHLSFYVFSDVRIHQTFVDECTRFASRVPGIFGSPASGDDGTESHLEEAWLGKRVSWIMALTRCMWSERLTHRIRERKAHFSLEVADSQKVLWFLEFLCAFKPSLFSSLWSSVVP